MVMEKFIKGIARVIEFGDYDNFVKITPDSFYFKSYNKHKISAVFTAHYDNGHTIEFVDDNIAEIDFSSFGTSVAAELAKIGLKESEAQFLRKQLYIIKNDDGTTTPFEVFKVSFDYGTYSQYSSLDRRTIKCTTQGEAAAIRYAERCVSYPSHMHNITVEKVGEVK